LPDLEAAAAAFFCLNASSFCRPAARRSSFFGGMSTAGAGPLPQPCPTEAASFWRSAPSTNSWRSRRTTVKS